MNRLSSNDPRGQQPDVIPFDSRAAIRLQNPTTLDVDTDADTGTDAGNDDFDHDCDTVTDDRGERGEGGNGNGNDEPPTGSPVAIAIRAPRGPQPVRRGFTIAAVEIDRHPIDGEEDICAAQFLTQKKLQSRQMAVGLANYKAGFPGKLPRGTTHIVVNDETGEEVFRKAVLGIAG